ncbi:hypothetical protein F511_35064 [Dorcoceras hygrometricum]|uniref:Uncharacterized protein n=1 Tax=Dorcoceras hygrometricum TaxID=472368 RepID=A0A2Z7AFN1_9LAMI|nr:hypothetical protein F511_35064 [Dorcoceras hygrometricum]
MISLRKLSTASLLVHHYDWISCVWFSLAAGYPVVGRKMLATGFIALKLSCDWYNILRLNA